MASIADVPGAWCEATADKHCGGRRWSATVGTYDAIAPRARPAVVLAIRDARDPPRRSTRELQGWMGHADFAATEIYLSYKPRADAARRLGEAFADRRSTQGGGAHSSRRPRRSARRRRARRARTSRTRRSWSVGRQRRRNDQSDQWRRLADRRLSTIQALAAAIQ
jgi:hypothetical protein